MPTNKGGTKVDNVVPINPAQARQKLDCIATLRKALEDMLWTHRMHGPCAHNNCKSCCSAYDKAKQALKEESEK